MQKLFAPILIELGKEIGRITTFFESQDQTTVFSGETKTKNKDIMAEHAQTFRSLGLEMCAMKAEEMVNALDAGMNFGQYSQSLQELYSRMCDECRLFCMLSLNAHETSLYEPPVPYFGPDVSTKFPSAAYEIDECTKCIALGRSTAAVFHMMRTMEIAIKAVSGCLNIPAPTKDAERNWGRILEKIKAEIDKRNKGAGWNNAGDKNLFEESYASLDAVRVAWRNTTMHVERTYTGEEAEHILGAARGFMRKIASRMDEKGDPKA